MANEIFKDLKTRIALKQNTYKYWTEGDGKDYIPLYGEVCLCEIPAYDEENPNQYKFRTKGDANKNVDANLIEPNQVLGKAIFSIPYLGYLATYIQTPSGSIVTICFAVSSIILVVIIDILVDSNKKDKKTTKK